MDIYVYDEATQTTTTITIQQSHTVRDLYKIVSEELNYLQGLIQIEYLGDALEKKRNTNLLEMGISEGQEMTVCYDKQAFAYKSLCDILRQEPSLKLLYHILQSVSTCCDNCKSLTDLYATAGYDISDLLLHISPTMASSDHVRHAISSGAKVTVKTFDMCDLNGPCVIDILCQYVDNFTPISVSEVSFLLHLFVSNNSVVEFQTFKKFVTKCEQTELLTRKSPPSVTRKAMVAMNESNKPYIELLIDYGGDINNSLEAAMIRQDEPMIDYCLSMGATFKHEDMSYLLNKSGVPIVKMIMEKHPKININKRIDFRDHGIIPLYAATIDGTMSLIKLLISCGSPIDDSYGNPLHVASTASVAELLLDEGADASFIDHWGGSPLVSAITASRDAVVKILLLRGADPNYSCQSDGNSLLHIACLKRPPNQNIISLLISSGASITVSNHNNEAPVDVSSKSVKKLISQLQKVDKQKAD